MNNLFGRALRTMLDNAGLKERALAEALSYDTTYISKWLNGSKLPSPRNAETVIRQIADILVRQQYPGGGAEQEAAALAIFDELKSAYDRDNSYISFQAYNNHKMSFLRGRQEVIELLNDALIQSLHLDGKEVVVTACFDLLRLYREDITVLIKTLRSAGAKKVRMTVAVTPEELVSDERFYTTSLLNIIGGLDFIELSMLAKAPKMPKLLTINDMFCMQILWSSGEETAAAFSSDRGVVAEFARMQTRVLTDREKLFDTARPEELRRTNVQLDSYSDKRQWLFFNEPPALLFPDDIMDQLIADAGTEEYATYLTKLKSIFAGRTSRSRIDLVLYSSMINRYLSEGRVSVGNVEHQLTREQARAHLQHLSRLMQENPDFHIWLIRDTTMLSDSVRRSPSLFVDTISVYIENAARGAAHSNFHISMDPRVRDAFQACFERMLEQPYCTKLTAEDLLRYL